MLRSEYEVLETKYQDLLRENLRMSREIMCKDLEINNWKEKYENMENVLSEEKKDINAERQEWKDFQQDLLLVVRAADDYKVNAMKTVAKFEKENASMTEQINRLEAKIKSLGDTGSLKPTLPQEQDNDNDNHLSLTAPRNKSSSLIQPQEEVELQLERPYPLNMDILTTPVEEIKPLAPCDNNKENCDAGCFAPHPPQAESKPLNNNSNPNNKRFNGVSLLNKKLPDYRSEDFPDGGTLKTFVKVAGGSKRNALLRWCQSRTISYRHVEITNFSTSWSDGMALCALLHSFLPDSVPYDVLKPENSRENFEIAFNAAEAAEIPTTLSIDEMVSNERPSWQKVMIYVQEIYNKLECCD